VDRAAPRSGMMLMLLLMMVLLLLLRIQVRKTTEVER
jgi:MYXO-CTERM domain-containing protein